MTKSSTGLQHIMVGLGWDEAQQSEGGFLGMRSKPKPIDCDASAILCGESGKYKDLVYFANLRAENDSVVHQGDNHTGEGEGDDEQIMVDLKKLSSDISKVVFVVNIYEASRQKTAFWNDTECFYQIS